MSIYRYLILIFIMLSMLSSAGADPPADLVLRNGKIITMESSNPEIQALAVRKDRIIAIGDNKSIQTWIGPQTQVMDLQGKFATPGWIEGHAHFLSIGRSKMMLDLTQVKNWEEIIKLVAEAVKKTPPGQWILGRGWHQEKWDHAPQPNVDGCPIHTALSAASPNHPVWLTHASGHMGFANAKAMQSAGVTSDTASPPGGEILKDSLGNLTGVFREEAQSLIGTAYERSRKNWTADQIQKELQQQADLGINACVSNGITGFHDAGSSFADVDFFKSLAQTGKLPLRLWIMINESNERLKTRLPQYRLIDFADHHLTVRAIKRFMDGALGSHTAWMLQPYNDLPTGSGINTEAIDTLRETAQLAMENQFQLCIHAIGDRANREVINLYETIFQQYPDKTDLRWRIEHAQHLHSDDIPRFHTLGVIAAMQGCHCTSDGPYVITRLGNERAQAGAYAWRSLLENGTIIVNGTDAPVEDVNPINSFYASVSRRMRDGKQFFPEQCMTREEALRSYTWSPAFAAFEEQNQGSLAVGKLADITVFSQDLLTVPEDAILKTKVLYTIVGGKVVYENKADMK